jgi:hypothetical protein
VLNRPPSNIKKRKRKKKKRKKEKKKEFWREEADADKSEHSQRDLILVLTNQLIRMEEKKTKSDY